MRVELGQPGMQITIEDVSLRSNLRQAVLAPQDSAFEFADADLEGRDLESFRGAARVPARGGRRGSSTRRS